jgi:hypothetical protein
LHLARLLGLRLGSLGSLERRSLDRLHLSFLLRRSTFAGRSVTFAGRSVFVPLPVAASTASSSAAATAALAAGTAALAAAPPAAARFNRLSVVPPVTARGVGLFSGAFFLLLWLLLALLSARGAFRRLFGLVCGFVTRRGVAEGVGWRRRRHLPHNTRSNTRKGI